ncbi:MAG: flavodoxin family protein [Nitrospirota bacterium]|jgi:multimeric flavodoxin WrbA
MKVIGFNASARKDGNTALLLNTAMKELRGEGIETEMVQLAGKHLKGCIACYKCFENKDRRCSVTDDMLNECIEGMLGADGILLGSPTYFADLSANMKALIERAGMVARANDHMFRRKVGAGVIAVRRAGATHVLSSINYFFLISQMVVPGSSYWNLGVGRDPGEVAGDAEGMETMRELGRNMAWVMKKLHS